MTRRDLLRSALAAGVTPFVACAAADRLPREDLMVYRGPNGRPRPVRTVEDWQARRAEIVEGFGAIAGKLPGEAKRCPLDMKTDEEKRLDGHRQCKITYASEPGSRVPAYLLLPDAVADVKARAPAVLALHPTDDRVGHGVLIGRGGTPYPPYAAELAKRGFIVLAPSYPLLAGYQPDVKGLGWASGTLKAVWDNIRGLDLLDSLPSVKPGRRGAIGHSLGGHNSVYTAVMDERIGAVVTSCGLDSFVDYYRGDEAVWKAGAGWTQLRYMPRLAEYRGRLGAIPFDFPELIGALAPRSVLIVAPLRDANFRAESVDRVVAAARPVYRLHGHEERLALEHPDCGHAFPPAMRERAYRFLEAALG